jgi:hypothetical protein
MRCSRKILRLFQLNSSKLMQTLLCIYNAIYEKKEGRYCYFVYYLNLILKKVVFDNLVGK